MKHVYSPHHGRSVVIGARKRPPAHMRVGIAPAKKYSLAPAPDFDYTTLAASLSTALADVLGNNTLGDCTSAGAGHLIDIFTAGGGNGIAITSAQAIEFYSLTTGYVPGNPATDQGADEVSVLTYWRDHGYDGQGTHAIAGFVEIDATNAAEMKSAAYLFGGLYFGVELPDSYINPFPAGNGFVWGTGTPDNNNGHCFVSTKGTDAGGGKVNFGIDSWGMEGIFTSDGAAELAVPKAFGTCFAVLSREWIDAMKLISPSGADWATLEADFEGLGGTVTPNPPPGPLPTPTTGPVTLAQAQSWAAAGIQNAFPLMTRAQAIQHLNDSLAKYWPATGKP